MNFRDSLHWQLTRSYALVTSLVLLTMSVVSSYSLYQFFEDRHSPVQQIQSDLKPYLNASIARALKNPDSLMKDIEDWLSLQYGIGSYSFLNEESNEFFVDRNAISIFDTHGKLLAKTAPHLGEYDEKEILLSLELTPEDFNEIPETGYIQSDEDRDNSMIVLPIVFQNEKLGYYVAEFVYLENPNFFGWLSEMQDELIQWIVLSIIAGAAFGFWV